MPAAAVVELGEVFGNDQFKSRGLFADIGLHRFVAQPARFSTGSVAPTEGPPGPGEHTEAVLAGLGYESGRIARLREDGTFGEVDGDAAQ